MKLRLTYLIQAVFAVLVAVGLSFGASRAMATQPAAAAVGTCPAMGYDYPYQPCGYGCYRNIGYCSESGICRCGQIP
jgi:hypothetical protein